MLVIRGPRGFFAEGLKRGVNYALECQPESLSTVEIYQYYRHMSGSVTPVPFPEVRLPGVCGLNSVPKLESRKRSL
jgi:hypothetical protein